MTYVLFYNSALRKQWCNSHAINTLLVWGGGGWLNILIFTSKAERRFGFIWGVLLLNYVLGGNFSHFLTILYNFSRYNTKLGTEAHRPVHSHK